MPASPRSARPATPAPEKSQLSLRRCRAVRRLRRRRRRWRARACAVGAQAGLEPEQAPRAKAKAGGARAADGRARRWRQPWHLDQLRLDAAALAAALAAGAPGAPAAGTRGVSAQADCSQRGVCATAALAC